MMGLFGAAGVTLDGQAFKLTYLFDTSVGTRLSGGPGTYDILYGGTGYGTASPALSTDLTIAGHTQSIGGTTQSVNYVCDVAYCPTTSVSSWSYYAYNDPSGISTQTSAFVVANGPDGAIPLVVGVPFALSNITGSGNFLFQLHNGASGNIYQTFGNLIVTQVSVSSVGVAPVPVPAAGLALLAALGGLGLAGRRRRA